MNKLVFILFVGVLVFMGCLGHQSSKTSPTSTQLDVESEINLQPGNVSEGEPEESDELEEMNAEVEEPIISNITNESNGTDEAEVEIKCDRGFVLEDGVCVKEEDYNTIRTLEEESSESNEGNGIEEVEEEQEKNISSNETNASTSPPDADLILNEVPDEVRDTIENFIGNKEDFEKLLDDLGKSNESKGKWEEIIREKSTLFDKGGVDLGKIDPLLAKSLLYSSEKGGFSIGSLIGETQELLSSGFELFSPTQRDEYFEPDYRIEKIETEWKSDGSRYFNIYFKSYAAMYTFVALEPLSVYIDRDNDGEWDIRYNVVYNEDQGKAYFYIKKRNDLQMLSRNLIYDVNKKKISFKLGDEIQGQRIFVWVGEPHTGLRYPKKNDVIVFLGNGKMMKNVAKYIVVLVDKLKVNDDKDTFQEGEIFFSNLMLFSRPLEEINADEARQLMDYRRRGVVGEKEVPKWFAYWLMKADTERIDGVELQKTSFPVLRWVEMNDGDEIFTDDNGKGLSAFPAFASRAESVGDSKIIFMGTYVGDYDDWPSSITDKTGWLLTKLIDKGVSSGGIAGEIVKKLTELMYYGVAGEYKSFSSIMRTTFDTIFSFFGAPDLVGAPSKTLNAVPHQNFNFPAKDGGAELIYALRYVNVPTVPMHLKVKLDKIKIKDRSDGLRGEYYFYGRVCTNVKSDGLYGGVSFSWPAGKTGKCVTEKFAHGRKKVWDGDKVAKNVVLTEGDIRAVPFVYVELQGWEEDKENWGDDDDPMGLLTRTILLDENNFAWDVESNRPHLNYYEIKDASKTKIYYRVEVN